jgi:hypothetical protein
MTGNLIFVLYIPMNSVTLAVYFVDASEVAISLRHCERKIKTHLPISFAGNNFIFLRIPFTYMPPSETISENLFSASLCLCERILKLLCVLVPSWEFKKPYLNAAIPVISFPKINKWISCVPS